MSNMSMMYKETLFAQAVKRLCRAHTSADGHRDINVAASIGTGVLMTLLALGAAKLSLALFGAIWIIAAVMIAYFWVGRDPGTWFGLDAVQAMVKEAHR